MIRLSDDLKTVIMIIGLFGIIVHFDIILHTQFAYRRNERFVCRKREENDVVFTVRVIIGG